MRILVKAVIVLAATFSVPGMLGDLTPQPQSAHPKGVLALGTYSALAKTDNVIDSHDAIAIPKFSDL